MSNQVAGGKDSPVTFHIMAVDDAAFKNSFGKFELDQWIVRDKLDEFLKQVIEERFRLFGMDERIKSQMDRRIEVAIKSILDRLTSDVTAQATQWAKERVRQQIADLPMKVRIEL